MLQGYRNAWFATIITKFLNDEDMTKGFFSLDGEKIYILGELAEAMKVKSSNGKSPARTLYDRAVKGLTWMQPKRRG